MSEPYLTASEIREIDGLNDITILDYLETIPVEKHELVLHLFATKRAVALTETRLLESEENGKRLKRLLEKNGANYA